MAEIINLNKARKARAAAGKKAQAASNRGKHGRSKAERSLTDAEKTRLDDTLDAHRLDRSGEDDPEPA